MTPVSWANDRATVTVPGVLEERGSTVADWDDPADVFDLRGVFEPGVGDLDPGAYAAEVAGVFRARGARPVRAPARVDVAGVGVFGLAADGLVWRSPTGAVSHVQLVLTKWEGR